MSLIIKKETVWLTPLGLFLIAIGLIAPVSAFTTNNLTTLIIDEDQFRNYDFRSETDSNTNVDWPVTMLHYNNAEIDKVKDIYFGPQVLSDLFYGRVNDGSGWIWDSDRGTKKTNFFSDALGTHVNLHMRLYAPNSLDYLENASWGKYVLGTTHYDEYPEPGSWHGYSEYAENDFVLFVQGSYTVFEDWSSFSNAESLRNENGHIWQNNGLATSVAVP